MFPANNNDFENRLRGADDELLDILKAHKLVLD